MSMSGEREITRRGAQECLEERQNSRLMKDAQVSYGGFDFPEGVELPALNGGRLERLEKHPRDVWLYLDRETSDDPKKTAELVTVAGDRARAAREIGEGA